MASDPAANLAAAAAQEKCYGFEEPAQPEGPAMPLVPRLVEKGITQHKIFRYRELFGKCVMQKDGRTMMVFPDRAIMTDPLVDTRLADGPFPELDGERDSYSIVAERRCEVAVRWREFYNKVKAVEDKEMRHDAINFESCGENRALNNYLHAMMKRWND